MTGMGLSGIRVISKKLISMKLSKKIGAHL